MRINTRQLLGSLLILAFFASCSRPVAHFQPTMYDRLTILTQATPASAGQMSPGVVSAPALVATPVQQLAQANVALDQMDVLVSADSKLAADKTVHKRLNRMQMLLKTASVKATIAPFTTTAPKKINLMERLMLKKMDKKISKQLAPNNPDKAMTIKGVLAIGAVLVLVGILLIALTTGGGFALGVIAFAAGIVLLLIGLL